MSVEVGGGNARGIRLTLDSDVSQLPADALALLPDAAVSRILTSLAQIFQSARPWSLYVAEADGQKLQVTMMRNGRFVATELISRADIGFAKDAPPAPDMSELYTAAATYVLVELSSFYPYLRFGLAGATAWQSIAAQMLVAREHLDGDTASRLLAYATIADPGNQTVVYTAIMTRYSQTGDRATLASEVEPLSKNEHVTGDRALELRVGSTESSGWRTQSNGKTPGTCAAPSTTSSKRRNRSRRRAM